MTQPNPIPETEVQITHPVLPWLTAPRRRWLYGVVTAAQPLLVAIAGASGSVVPLVIATVLAAIGTGTATAHTAQAQ
jgi:hypothetical protein